MDLNDPRRRLQVLNNANPSIRIATAPAPQQQISIAQPKTPNLKIVVPKSNPAPVPQAAPNTYKSIDFSNPKNKTIFGMNAAWLLPKNYEKTYSISAGNDVQSNPDQFLKNFDNQADDVRQAYVSDLQKKQATDPVAAQTLKLLSDSGRFKGGISDFAAGANDKLYGGLSRGFLRGVDFVLPGHNTFGLEQEANRQEAQPQYTQAGKAGEKFGSVEKGIVDVATMALGGGVAEAGASKIPALAEFMEKLQNGGKVSQVAAKALGILPGSLGGSAVNTMQTAGKGEDQNVLKSILEGTAVDLGIPVLGKVLGKGISFLRGGEASEAERVLKGLISSNDEGAIRRELEALAPDADREVVDQLTKYISNETDPNAVRSALNALQPAETAVADAATDTIKFHDPSHPTQEWLNQNMPGMHVPGSPDPVNVMAEKVKDFKDPSEFKKYIDSLTGEEKAVADAGLSDLDPEEFYSRYKAAEAGKAQSGTSLPPEDVQAIKEAGGVVPNEVEDPGTVFHLPQHNVHAKLTPEQAAILSDETKNIPFTADDRPHLTAGERVRQATKEVTQEELGKLSPNAKAALENADKQIAGNADTAKAVEDVSKAQTGVSDGAVAGDGKTTSPEAVQGDNVSQVDSNTTSGGNAVKSAENGSESVMPQKAEDIVPNADQDTKTAVQNVLDELNNAQTSYNVAAKARSVEKGQRAGAMAPSYEAVGGGEAGVRAKLGALKGKYTESSFSPITASESTQKTILDDIENSNLRDFEKLNTQNAIRKIWGANEGKPTPSDINYIRKYFGDDMANAIEEAVAKDPETWRDTAAKIAGTPRALMATADFSFGGRQGAPLGTRFPKEWARANKESVKYAANKEYFERAMKEIRDDDAYETITDKMKVALTGANESVEEGFAAADYAEKIPGAGRVVQGSDRAYTGGLTKLRFDTAKKIIDSYGGVDQFNKFFEGNEKAIKDLGEVINTFSGRGGKAGGLVEQHMKTLSTTLFAPRLWAAKLNSLNPVFYARLSPEARKLAIQTQGAFLTTAGTVLAMAAAIPGVDVGWDPRSADFAKIKVGNTRYDILGGLQQNIRLGAQLATGQKINSTTGEMQTLGDGFGKPTRKDILLQAFESKENPLLSYATKLLEGKDQGGNPINPLTEGAKLGIPLNLQGIYETAKDRGDLTDPKNLAVSAGMSLPGFFGAGVQTYGNTRTADTGKDSTGKLVFKGKITPDMVLNNSGQPILDDKGRPVKAKFPEGATDVEKKALLDEKRNSALRAEFTRQQSSEDQALMKLNDTQLKNYVKDGTIDQDKYDQIQRLQKGAENYGKSIGVPDGANSTPAKTFYQKWNSMTTKDQDYWLKEPADDNAKVIAKQLNKQRSEGLSPYKPSNALSKAYAEYEKDINSHQYTDVEKRDKAKAFQTFAYKLNYSDDVQEVFKEGSSTDLRTLIDSKQISKKDLDEAIKLDDELYNSGLTGSLKFSKKFRAAYGYGLPSGGKGANRGTMGGAKAKSIDQHLLDYLPSKSSGNGSPAPQFSSKRRTQGISFKSVSLPSKSGKKISINL